MKVGWTALTKLMFSPGNTVAMFLNGRLVRREPIIELQGERIWFQSAVRYLGITLNRSALFSAHALNAAYRAKTKYIKSTCYTLRAYGVQSHTYDILYKMVFIPIITYAELAWAHRMGHSLVKKALRSAQCIVLRTAFGTVSNLAIMTICGHPPLNLIGGEDFLTQKKAGVRTTNPR